MISNNTFTDNTNKALLWELLFDNTPNIDNKDYESFKTFFDSHITSINKDLNNKGINSLMEKNKYFITNTIYLIRNNSWKNKYSNNLYTSKDLKEKNMSEFEERFMERQKEFTNMINVSKPDDVSFDDNLDTPIQNIEEVLKIRQEEREKEITFENNENNDENNNFKKIKIIDNDETDIPKKKVTFNSIVDSIDYKEDDINDMKFIKVELKKMNEEMLVLRNMIKDYQDTLLQYLNRGN